MSEQLTNGIEEYVTGVERYKEEYQRVMESDLCVEPVLIDERHLGTIVESLYKPYVLTYGARDGWAEGAVNDSDGTKISLEDLLSLSEEQRAFYRPFYPFSGFLARVSEELIPTEVKKPFLVTSKLGELVVGGAWGVRINIPLSMERIMQANYKGNLIGSFDAGNIWNELVAPFVSERLRTLFGDEEFVYFDEIFVVPSEQRENGVRTFSQMMACVCDELIRLADEKESLNLFFRTSKNSPISKLLRIISRVSKSEGMDFTSEDDFDGIVYYLIKIKRENFALLKRALSFVGK